MKSFSKEQSSKIPNDISVLVSSTVFFDTKYPPSLSLPNLINSKFF